MSEQETEATFDERKQALCQLVIDLQVDVDRILKVAPNSVPPQLRSLLKTGPDKLASSLDTYLEQVEEEQRPEFLEFLIMATGRLKQGHTELMESLSRRIQPEGEDRTPPRKFKGFKKRRGEW